MGLPFFCRLAADELPAVRLSAAGGWGSNRASFWLLTRSVVGLRSGWLGSGLVAWRTMFILSSSTMTSYPRSYLSTEHYSTLWYA